MEESLWGQNQKWLHHPCLLRGPELGGLATQPLPPWGSPERGDKIRSGYITPAFSGGRNWAEWLHNPCLLWGPQKWGLNQKRLHNPYRLTSAQSGDTSKLVHGQFHIGDGPQRHHLWGEETQKGKEGNKNRGERVHRGTCYIKSAYVYVPLYCLYSTIITQIVCCRARRTRHKISKHPVVGTGIWRSLNPRAAIETCGGKWGIIRHQQIRMGNVGTTSWWEKKGSGGQEGNGRKMGQDTLFSHSHLFHYCGGRRHSPRFPFVKFGIQVRWKNGGNGRYP